METNKGRNMKAEEMNKKVEDMVDLHKEVIDTYELIGVSEIYDYYLKDTIFVVICTCGFVGDKSMWVYDIRTDMDKLKNTPVPDYIIQKLEKI